MTAKFYVLVDPESTDAFWSSRDDMPAAFETEDEAIVDAKLYSSPTLVLKSVVRVTEICRHKVERIK
jgi:hypothetical protein